MDNTEYIKSLEEKISVLEAKLSKAEKIKTALISRVERNNILSDTDYSIFESNIVWKKLLTEKGNQLDKLSDRLNLTLLELEAAERSLNETKEQHDGIINSIEDIVWSLSYPDYSIVFLNEAAARIYGRDLEDFYNDRMLWLRAVHYEDKENVLKGIENVKETGKNQMVYRIIRSDGQIRFMLDKSKAIYSKDGRLIRINGLSRDITDLKIAEEQLLKTKLQYESIFESTSDGIVILDKKSNIVALNKQLCKMFGYKKLELLGKSIKHFLNSYNVEKIKLLITNLIFAEKFVFESTEFCKDGSIANIEIRGSAFNYEGEQLFIILISDISERKKTELDLEFKTSQLIESDYKLKAILDNSNQTFFLIAPDYQILAFNSAGALEMERTIGKKVEQQSSMLDYIPPDYLEEFTSNMTRAFSGETVKNDRRLDLPNQPAIFFSFSYNPVISAEGKVESVVLNAIEITDFKIAEQEISEQMNFLRTLIETIPSPIFYKNKAGVFLGCNQALEQFLDLSRSEIIGKTIYDIAPYEIAQKYDELDIALYIDGEYQAYESTLNTKSDELKHVIFHKATFMDRNGEVAGLIGTIVDITDRKHIENKLIASQNEIQTIYDSTPILMCVVDSNLKIRNANLSFVKYTSWKDNQAHPDTIGGILSCINSFEKPGGCGYGSNCYTCSMRMAFRDTLNTGIMHNNVELKTSALRKGKRLDEYYLVSTARIMTPTNLMVLISFQDITERKRIEAEQVVLFEQLKESKEIIEANLYQKSSLIEELEQSKERLRMMNAEKDKFFSILAHDLKNPFSLLRNHTEELISNFEKIDKEEQLSLLHDIKDTTGSVYKLLENLLDWSRIQTGKFQYRPTTLDLSEVAFNTVYTFSPIAKQKGIVLHSDLQSETYITADYYMMNTIFRNLVSNALKFTEQGGRVHIASNTISYNNCTYINIAITDTGIGIDAELMNDLFKIDKTVTKHGTIGESGTGLGLILCKEFVEKQNGFISVDSKPGVGSSFNIAFPVS